jgi:uncharacterized protein (DUF433 family)
MGLDTFVIRTMFVVSYLIAYNNLMRSIPTQLMDVLHSDPEILSGAVRFVGTRVPVQALLDTIAGGYGLDYFLEDFPDVSQDQAVRVLEWQRGHSENAFLVDEAS